MWYLFLYFAHITFVTGIAYKEMKHVTPLSANNFADATARGRWIIVFYRKNCGHCIAYSDYVNDVSTYTRMWKWAVRFGSIPCNEEINLRLCNEHLNGGVPTVKFSANGTMNRILNVDKNFDVLLGEVLGVMIPEVRKISADNYALPNTLNVSSPSERDNTAIVLNFTHTLKAPMASVIDRNARIITVKNSTDDRIIAKGTFSEVQQTLSQLAERISPGVDDVAVEDVLPEYVEVRASAVMPVHAQDIFAALTVLLKSDVSSTNIIVGEDMDALKEFIDMLILVLPASPTYIKALRELQTWLSGMTSLRGLDWHDQLKVVQLPIYDGPYAACKGSKPEFRGYPCGLWTMWHALTVEHYLNVPNSSGDLVAHAMNRFMPRFFSCLYCAFHFAANSANLVRPGESILPQNRKRPNLQDFEWDAKIISTLPARPNTSLEEVMWLNAVHNRVNLRLAGSPSEDPTAPKVIYTPAAVCPTCWTTDTPSGEYELAGSAEAKYNLLNFLVTHYRASSWQASGMPTEVFDPTAFWSQHPRQLKGNSTSYSDLFAVSILSVLLSASAVVVILFLSRFLWRCKRGRRRGMISLNSGHSDA